MGVVGHLILYHKASGENICLASLHDGEGWYPAVDVHDDLVDIMNAASEGPNFDNPEGWKQFELAYEKAD